MRKTIAGILKNFAAISTILLVALLIAGIGQGIRRLVLNHEAEQESNIEVSASAVTYSVMLGLDKTNSAAAEVSPSWMVPHTFAAMLKLGLLGTNELENALAPKLDEDTFYSFTNYVENTFTDVWDEFDIFEENFSNSTNDLWNSLLIEETTRESVDLSLSNRLNVAESDIVNVRDYSIAISNVLSNSINNEIDDRVAGDLAGSNNVFAVSSLLVNAVDQESESRIAGDLASSNYVDFAIGAETQSRVAGDLAGSNNVTRVDNLLSERIEVTSNALASAITDETQQRIYNDSLKIDVLNGNATNLSVNDLFGTGTIIFTNALAVRAPTPIYGDSAATANWVLDKLSIGIPYYSTTNVVVDMAFPPPFDAMSKYWASDQVPPESNVVIPLSSLTNGQYIAAVVLPKFSKNSVIRGPLSASSFIEYTPSRGNSRLELGMETYYTYDGTNLFGGFIDGVQIIQPSPVQQYNWAVSFNDFVFLEDGYVVVMLRLIKADKVNNLIWHRGGAMASNVRLRQPYSSVLYAETVIAELNGNVTNVQDYLDLLNNYDKVNTTNIVELESGLNEEVQNRILGDLAGSNYVDSVGLALSNRINSVEFVLSGTSNSLAGSIASLGTNLSYSIEYTTAVSNKFNTAITNETVARIDSDSSISNLVVYLEGGLAQEIADRIAGDLEGSNHVDSVGLILSNRVSSVEDLINSVSNELEQAISTESQNRIAGDITNHNEIVGVQAYAEAVSNKFDSAVYVLETNLNTKVSTNHTGNVIIHGGITADTFIGDGSQLSGVSGGVEFPELTIGSSPTTTTVHFSKDYKYYHVLATNTTDVVFDYAGIGDFTGCVLEFQIRITLTNPLSYAATIPAEGEYGVKYVGDMDMSATITNTVQHLGMMMYSTNNVLLSHWYFDEP